jgi:hypothetical protein
VRLWTLHPRYLDPQGLVALWREALLAQRVLDGGTRGYRNHPQLLRFRLAEEPLVAIGSYLRGVFEEAKQRGYAFNAGLILTERRHRTVAATAGQLAFEGRHLRSKLAVRSPELVAQLEKGPLEAHPLFRIVAGPIEPWERATAGFARA